jgi:hypothetical protein
VVCSLHSLTLIKLITNSLRRFCGVPFTMSEAGTNEDLPGISEIIWARHKARTRSRSRLLFRDCLIARSSLAVAALAGSLLRDVFIR